MTIYMLSRVVGYDDSDGFYARENKVLPELGYHTTMESAKALVKVLTERDVAQEIERRFSSAMNTYRAERSAHREHHALVVAGLRPEGGLGPVPVAPPDRAEIEKRYREYRAYSRSLDPSPREGDHVITTVEEVRAP